MTYQTITGFAIPERQDTEATTGLLAGTSVVIDADGEGLGGVYQIPVTDTLTKIGFVTDTVTTGGDLGVRIETVGADGFPTGTLWGAGASGTISVLSTDDATWLEFTLTAGTSVTRGDLIAIIITRPSGSTFNGSFYIGIGFPYTAQGFPYGLSKTTSWVLRTFSPNLSLYFSTGGYVPIYGGACIELSSPTVTFNNGSTPDIVGNILNFPWDIKVDGFWTILDIDTTVNIKLIDSDGSTVLATTAFNENTPPNNGALTNLVRFTSDIALSANTNYYLVMEPTTASNASIYQWEFPSAAVKGQSPHHAYASKVSAKDPTGTSSWTIDTTKVASIGLMVKEIDIPTGGGSSAFTWIG